MKDAITAQDLPGQCRTWDDKRRVWVAKTRYATDREANLAILKDRKMQAYRCKASSGGVHHFHVGHSKGKR